MVFSPEAVKDLLEYVRVWVRAQGTVNAADAIGSLSEAESVAEEVRSLCGQAALEAAVGAVSAKATYRGTRVGCACGSQARFVSYRQRWIKTLCGETKLSRAYYHCASCGRGQAPWDGEQGLNALVWTPRTKALVSQACARLPYRETVQLLSEARVVQLEESSAEEIVREVGGRLRQEEQVQQERVRQAAAAALAVKLHVSEEVPEKAKVVPSHPVRGKRIYVSLDAAKAHIDGDWHDVKVGAIYTPTGISSTPGAPEEASGEPSREVSVDRLGQRTYVASQRASEAFGWQLRTQAVLWSQPAYAETVVIGDGAEYNWKVAEAHFAGAVQILDFFHAAEHVWELSRALYRQEDAREKALGERWAREMVSSLKEAGPDRLLRSLTRRKPKTQAGREALERAAGYFSKNRMRMDYAAFRARGMMIGSGPVEAGCKVVVGQRMKQSGMRWSAQGADAILALRTAVLSSEQARIQRAAMAA